MKGRARLFLAAMFLLGLSCPLHAEEQKYMQARIILDSPQQILELRTMHLDVVWQGDNYVEIITDTEELDELRARGLRTEIVHKDVVAFYQSRIPDKALGWKTLSQLEMELFFLNIMYPDLTTERMSIGKSIENRDIYAFKISDNPDIDEEEPEVLYTALIHAREGVTAEVLLYFMNYLLENYGSDPEATYIIDNRELWFILIVNPDGYNKNMIEYPGGGGMWRKNLRDNGDGTVGVDLNRNFGYMWGYDNIGSSPNGDDPTYRGTGPFSEPETQVMRDFSIAHDFIISVYYHTYSNLVLWPWGYEVGLYTPDEPIFHAIGRTIKSFNSYAPGPGWTLYPTNGASDDWYYGEQTLKDKTYAFTIEVGSYDDGFWCPLSRVTQLCQENLPGNLYLAGIAGNINSVFPPDAPALTVPDSVDIGAPFEVNWLHEDTLNPAVNFELVEMAGQETVEDSAYNFDNWVNNSFEISSFSYSGGGSFYSGAASYAERYFQSRHAYLVKPGDALRFWVYYAMTEYFDFAYVEVSTDGIDFTPIPGNITTLSDPYGHSRGPGITGFSYWTEGVFGLSDYVGQEVYFRFSYKDHSLIYAWDGIYIDDIYPVGVFDSVNIISSTLTDTAYSVAGKPEGWYYYKVRAQDADGQWGGYSTTETVVVAEPVLYYCGDADGNGEIDAGDLTFLIDYMFADGLVPGDIIQGDADDCGSINISDVAYLMEHLFGSGPAPCERTTDCLLPTGNNRVDIGCPLEVVIRQEDDSVAVPVYFTNDAGLKSLSIGFRCNSGVAEITSVDIAGTAVPDPISLIYKFVPGENKVLLGYTGSGGDIAPQEDGLLATLWVTITGGSPEQTIDLDSTFVTPAGEFIFSSSGGGTIIPDYYDCGSSEITVLNYICGDADADNSVNMLDILSLISYLYKGGPAPEPTESADVNHDGSVDMLDILYLINYLYKGGPEPDCA